VDRERPRWFVEPQIFLAKKDLIFGPGYEAAEIDEVVTSMKTGWLYRPKVARFEKIFRLQRAAFSDALNSCCRAAGILAAGSSRRRGHYYALTLCATVIPLSAESQCYDVDPTR
jgi:hypothetical protein